MRVILIGSVSSSWHTLRGLIRGGVEVAGVLGLDPAHANGVSDYRDLRALAVEHGIPYQPFQRIADPAVYDFVLTLRADLLFVVGLSQLAPRGLIGLAGAGAIGFHPTPLPRGRGRAPVAWTILLDEPAAANLFYLTDEADAGDIIAQRPVPVRDDDHAQDLIDRTNEVLEAMVFDLAPALRAGTLPRTQQDATAATWYARRTPEDGRIDWSQPAERVDRLVRAASRPYPGAFTYEQGQKVVVWRAQRYERHDHVGTLGQVVRIDAPGLLVQCGEGLLWLTELSDERGAARPASSFRVGQRFGCGLLARLDALESRVRDLERRLRPRGG